MINKTNLFLIMSISIFLLYSCRKLTNGVMTGTYKGTFTIFHSDTSFSGNTEIKLQRIKYSCKGNSNRIPAGGSGQYEIKKDKIIFYDENIWTCDFNQAAILNNEYKYTSKDRKLILTKISSDGSIYKYELEKE